MDQTQYLKDKLDKFNFGDDGASSPLSNDFLQQIENAPDDYEPNFPYRSAVGSLMYAMVSTRPDIATAVSVVSRYLHKPKKIHCDMVRKIFKYIKSNNEIGLYYDHSGNRELIGYVDASYANGINCHSISGYGFMLAGALISWNSQHQPIVALSTAEAEYIAVTPASQEGIWLILLLKNLGFPQETVVIMEDNQACIALSKNPQDHKRTKHIQVRYHFIREQIRDGKFSLKYCPTKSQLADMFTKGLPGKTLRNLRAGFGLKKLNIPGETCDQNAQLHG